ncbi:DUF2237 family protein [Endozoicomonas elysicola]|uniref:DUF2237 domain-containing protein n=1 Tax=Endozoicomonas elysicola TaxID=305900 RepID=A0A081KDP6_9GAMM|nr:DUF2237 domain-containing protein [Endozoicomonas elysicola]KEI72272.1 hypothetical protein GV64_17390 [Endozoicomonas elysicola]
MVTLASTQKNVFNKPLKPCCLNPAAGFFRDGFCHTVEQDVGRHTVCALMTDEFLKFSLSKGNDLITPRPEWGFPGLKAGDRWCLCANRWNEALKANVAPPVFLEATHQETLNIIPMTTLQKFAV